VVSSRTSRPDDGTSTELPCGNGVSRLPGSGWRSRWA